ncbi:MerR family transcriptional regulator [Clostridium omnivorum]|uniref:Uncharacterized protein n=1 Tax=Clostridium omnivorum TaxID=1604902 RepID=A0ABQ5N4L0_9CLOT|nr:MerR family transcriptional regulator [Clostridium sp. E14]GLC30168.1 hypothetical protein bsdE14_15780 [Clostridium sp. E14]
MKTKDEFIDEIKELEQVSLGIQILKTLALSGPLLWLLFNIINKKYDFIGINIILTIISIILLTLSWNRFLKQPSKKIKGTVTLLSSILVSLILTMAVFAGISKLQEMLFAPRDYLMYMFKPPYSYLVFFFEIEIIGFLCSILYKKVENSELKWAYKLVEYVKKNIAAAILLNIILLYMCITAVTVVTENKIIDYSFYNPLGKTYSYSDISNVQTGFKGKLLNTFKKNAGEFYYIVTFNNGKKINFYQANSKFEDTYLELEVFDNLIMKTGKVEKVSSSDNSEYCDLDARYVNRFLRIIDHR